MSQINVDNLAGLVPRETTLPDHARVRGQPVEAEPFGSHFWRVQKLATETVPGGQPDAARPSQPSAGPPEAPQPLSQERRPAADHPRSDPQDSANVEPDENAAAAAAAGAAAEDNRPEAAQGDCDVDDRGPSETAEPASQARQGQETKTNQDADQPTKADPHEPPAKASPHRPNGQGGKGVVQPASERAATHGVEKGVKPAQHNVAKEQAAKAGPAARSPAHTAAEQAAPSLQRLRQQTDAVAISGAAANVRAADKTAGQRIDNSDSRNPAAENAAQMDKQPGGQQNSLTPASQTALPLLPPLQRAKQGIPGEQAASRAGKPRSGKAALVAAAALGTEAQAAANRSAVIEDEKTGLAAEPQPIAPENPTTWPPTAAADSRLNVPLRISPSPDARVAPAAQLHQSVESADGDRARFVQRVARAFQAVGKSSGSIRLRLSPPDLGSLRLEIHVRSGLLRARVEAETPAARNLLLDNLPTLRERLAQQDIKVRQFDVALTDRSAGGAAEQTAGQTHGHRHSGSEGAWQPSGDSDREAEPTSIARSVNRPGEGTQLNVVI